MSKSQSVIEAFFIETRGYVSRVPDNGKAVITLSGGLDSVVGTAFCLEGQGELLNEGLGLEVYPIFIKRGQKSEEEEMKSVEWFDQFFSERYDRYHPVEIVEKAIPEIRSQPGKNGHPMRQSSIVNTAVQYAVKLDGKRAEELGVGLNELREKEKIRTIYMGEFEERCATEYPHSTLEGLRSLNFLVCQQMDDASWQITSPFYDPQIHLKYDKPRLIEWAKEYEIPVEKTFSCYEPVESLHCGSCSSCNSRKEAFKIAKIEDKTPYAGE